nr:DUF3307 domain-containing protein [uncultured Celeribacter sp.]
MAETLAALFLAHVLADYVFQTDRMVATKDKAGTLLLHAAVVWLCMVGALGTWGGWPLLALAGLHLSLDTIKTFAIRHGVRDGLMPYLTDQLAHLASLLALAAYAPQLWHNGVWAGGWFETTDWLPPVMALIAGGIFATRAGGFAVGKLMAPYVTAMQDTTDSSLPSGGMKIGLLERGLIFLLIFAGHPGGIGFLIAAKSILRFDATSDNAKAEYVIIGTLASFGWAIAVSLITMGLLRTLNGLPLLEIGAITP